MEYVDGPTLDDKIRTSPDDPREVAQIAWDLLDLVDAFQQRGLFHNDLHGKNVLVVHLEEAQARLQASLAKQPHHSKANVALGDIAVRKGDLPTAKSYYETAIDSDPKSGPAHYKLSTVLLRLHDTERAEKERTLGASLNAQSVKASKTVLVLADPDGKLLSGVKTRGDQ